VGTAGWADRELIASGWYPPGVRSPAERLRHYAGRFALVEADSPYYAIPKDETTAGWAQNTPEGFTMDVKAYSLLTGHRTQAATLPPDLRPLARDAWLTASTAPPQLLDAAWQRYRDALAPLRRAGRLGLVVLQFPPSCRPGPLGARLVEEALARCGSFQTAVEFRHGSWLEPAHRDRALALLRSHDAAFVCVDMPQSHKGAMPPLVAVTAGKAVIRLHGRSQAWAGGSKEERYRYEYTAAELASWADQARRLSQEVDEIHIVLNTCCAGAAQRAAARLRDLLEHEDAAPLR
jgi:uncharacterized protein YecE (DUF72 family)